MSGLPWFKFSPSSWRGDQALRAVSLAARGLWIDCLCIMHEAKPYGHLTLNGAAIDDSTLARMTGVSLDEVQALMAELRKAGVLGITGKGVVFSRRMTKDHAKAQKGRKSANLRWSQHPENIDEPDGPNGSPNGHPNAESIEVKREDRENNAPHSEDARARADFEKLKAVFPINPKSNLKKAAEAFNKLPASEQAEILASAQLFRAWFMEDCVTRNRSSDDGAIFAPHLVNWIRSGDWRKAASLPTRAVNGGASPDLVVLHADDPRFEAIQRARGRPIIVGKNGTATFTKAEVERAAGDPDSDAA